MARRKMGIILTLLFCLCLIPYSVQAVSTADAKEPISIEKKCDLTISYRYEEKAIEKVPVRLYQIGTISADMQYTPTEAFQTIDADFNKVQTNDEWNAIRSTLESHILANNIDENFAKSTDANGQVHFNSLEPGLYLAVSDSVSEGKQQYAFQSALITLPGLDANGIWQYQMTVSPKPAILPPTEDDVVEYKILKLWQDEGNKKERPKSIEVEIFRNGESYETVTLSDENNWAYSWKAPADGTEWTVAEKNIPDKYTVKVEEKATTFVLTNKYIEDKPVVEKLPKTGDTRNMLVYAILMFIAGIGLILLGINGKRERS